ncbi:DUF3631 domain-containing protein [Actinomadura napierensis]|uniref:DUF3631 domain-containing protein n=1 Tax=Actinomadura napierensis TaxID=267854 RepID=A0ABN2YZP9_9ACTN
MADFPDHTPNGHAQPPAPQDETRQHPATSENTALNTGPANVNGVNAAPAPTGTRSLQQAGPFTPGPESVNTVNGPTNGAALLNELRAALCRYVILPSPETADAVVLWIAATHAQPSWETATRLVISAPEKRCGKSRLLDVIEATCHNPLIAVNISPAALVRSIGPNPPTLLLDEADTVFGPKAADHEDLRGILNAGHQRNRPYIRWDAAARAPEHCHTFAMASLAGIGQMPDTIADRAVIVGMRRRAPGETVKPYRTRRDAPPLQALRERLATWANQRLDELADAQPEMPVEDRAADNWEPLIAVADAAGGDWPHRARNACIALTQAADTDTSAGVRLLADLRTVFADADHPEGLHGAVILERLHAMEEAPWADWYGQPLNARNLAKLLKPYGVTSTDVKVGGKGLKGYRREHLADAWSRYLPAPQEGSATSATSATAQVIDPPPVASRGQLPRPATGDPSVTSQVAEVAEVADTPRPVGQCATCHEPMTPIEPGQTTHPLCPPNRSERLAS